MKYLLAAICLISTTLGYAQKQQHDILYLKNGSIIYGTVKDRSDKVKVQVNGGSLLVYSAGEVDSIRQEPAGKAILRDFHSNYYRHNRGYRNITEVQLLYGTRPAQASYWYTSQTSDDIGLSVHTINGYQVWPYLYVGAGVGMDRMLTYRQTFVPLYMRVSSEFLKKRITPYVFIDAGYAWMVADEVSKTDDYKYYNRQGGLYITAGGGIRIYTRSRASIMIGAGYRRSYSQVDYAYKYEGSPDYTVKRMYQRLVVSVGVSF